MDLLIRRSIYTFLLTSVSGARDPGCPCGQSTGTCLRLERTDGVLWGYLRVGGESQARRSCMLLRSKSLWKLDIEKGGTKKQKKFENERTNLKKKPSQEHFGHRSVILTFPLFFRK